MNIVIPDMSGRYRDESGKIVVGPSKKVRQAVVAAEEVKEDVPVAAAVE